MNLEESIEYICEYDGVEETIGFISKKYHHIKLLDLKYFKYFNDKQYVVVMRGVLKHPLDIPKIYHVTYIKGIGERIILTLQGSKEHKMLSRLINGYISTVYQSDIW